MKHRKHGLRALGLSSVAVLGLMAFMAAGAQAEAKFLYLEKGVLKTLAGESEPFTSLHTDIALSVPAKNLRILCPRVLSNIGSRLLGTNLTPFGGVGHGEVNFLECKSFLISTGAEQKNCVPRSPAAPAGEIRTAGLVKLILHPANNTMMLFEKLIAPLATIQFPELCALFTEGTLTGSLVAECGELKPALTFLGGNCATHRVTQLLKSVSEALAKELGDALKFGSSPAFVEGIATVQFGAPCAFCAWGADAE